MQGATVRTVVVKRNLGEERREKEKLEKRRQWKTKGNGGIRWTRVKGAKSRFIAGAREASRCM